MFVHPSVPIDNLTSEQAKAIFTGQITNWSQVSGPDTAVIVYVRNEENGNTQVLRKGILGNISLCRKWPIQALFTLSQASDPRFAICCHLLDCAASNYAEENHNPDWNRKR